jgi:hypothetical protein
MTFAQRLWNNGTVIMDVFSSESFKLHSHAVGLFLLYLFLHFYFASVSAAVDDGLSNGSRCNKKNNNHRDGAVRQAGSSTAITGSSANRNTVATRSLVKLNGKDMISSSPTSSVRSISSLSGDQSDIVDDEVDDDEVLNNNHFEENMRRMGSICPDSTIAERRRFLLACNNNVQKASNRLNFYIEWRCRYLHVQEENDIRIQRTNDYDYDTWVESCMIARVINEEPVLNIVLPRVIRTYLPDQMFCRKNIVTTSPASTESYVTDNDGSRIFHIVPAMMDDRLAKQSTYTGAVAIYLDKMVSRESMEKVTICMDVRAGRGWPNIHAVRLVPFMKNSLKLLLPLFPERLYKCVVYPLPSAFFYLWTMMSKCIDPDTRDKIRVVPGKCTIESPPPTDKLIVHLGEEQAYLLEKSRVESFKA